MYPYKPQFYYIKVGCRGAYITRTCWLDVLKYKCLLFSEPTALPTGPRKICKGKGSWNNHFTMKWLCSTTCISDHTNCNTNLCVCEEEKFRCIDTTADKDDMFTEFICTSLCSYDFNSCPDRCKCNFKPVIVI